ncbi:hypothetical protein ACFQ21_00045 [Ohtaekwangia kribbensis]|uniref:Uncharacterized protein n=1 Tax=Ohtaekwangia kribbensis TaxID=688913 RepID=A0ABW3JUQ1_9BACT
MKLYNTKKGIIIEHLGAYFLSEKTDWDAVVNRSNLFAQLLEEIRSLDADASLVSITEANLLPPISQQEVWASGVTYQRSREYNRHFRTCTKKNSKSAYFDTSKNRLIPEKKFES